MEVARFVHYGLENVPCDYPISFKQLERGETFIIVEYWCKKNIYKHTCHDDYTSCIREQRKRK